MRTLVEPLARTRARVVGTVQGVGFRPYVYRLARSLSLAGWVLNDAEGVLLEIEGDAVSIEAFLARLPRQAPPLARVERIDVVPCSPVGEADFVIRTSSPAGVAGHRDAPVTPDSATCEACLAELRDPADRRHRYPFINCTDCGPRFTIVRGVPYDRPLTTMAGFTMCPDCRAEYEDPGNRRFHAQPNACPVCGPSVSLEDFGRVGARQGHDPVHRAALAVLHGAILAVKGIGGYHLACLASDEAAVARLRARKHREDKPFALMTASLAEAEALVVFGDADRALLLDPARPIVLAPRRPGAAIAPSVAPRARELGVMIAYSPLHHLLLGDVGGPLVMTSGNVSDEPIAYRDGEAAQRLRGIADLVLTHDRPIETRTDDSVARVVGWPGGRSVPTLLRRSRGYVPASLPLPGGEAAPPILAGGAQLKSTFCLARGGRAWVSHHIGDLQSYETLRAFTEGVAHFERLFDVTPQVVAHDLHPDYLSTAYALEREGVTRVAVQHHHAHLAACLAEHGEHGPAVGAIFDGSGYGTDGTVWGGELLVGDCVSFERVGSLAPVRLPGGERAIREPWRMACAWLAAASGEAVPAMPPSLVGSVDPVRWEQVAGLARGSLASPMSSSMGRLFDAVAALCGICPRVSYEGQAAIELEAACAPGTVGERYPVAVNGAPVAPPDGVPGLCLDPREALLCVAEDMRHGRDVGLISARFHAGVATGCVEACTRTAEAHGVELVVLAGGVFANRRLLEAVAAGLDATGLRALTPLRLPAGDGGISFGQAAIAARQMTK